MTSVKKLRMGRDLKSCMMAKELNMPPTTYSDKERGRRRFKPAEIVRICQMFDVRVEEITDFYA